MSVERARHLYALYVIALFHCKADSVRWHSCWRHIDALKARYAL